MIRLTYAELMSFNSPVITKLLSSDSRQFPTDDAIRIAGFINQIQPMIKLYQEQARKTVEQFGGTIKKEGGVQYKDQETQSKVESELVKLNDVEVELTGDLLTKTDNWPNLSIYEAMILRPLINVDGESVPES